MLAQYNEVIPDGAERILRMAEKQQDHRHHLEKVTVESNAAQSKRGTIAGVACIVSAYLVSGFLAYTGHDAAAEAITATVTVVFGGAYVFGIKFRQKDQAVKEETRKALRDKR
jgi:uncharacterized membrane protein